MENLPEAPNTETQPKPRRRSKKARPNATGTEFEALQEVNPIVNVEEEDGVLILHALKGKKNRSKEVVAQWLQLRMQNPSISKVEAAERIGIPRSSLFHHLDKAVKEGWLRFSDPLERLEHSIIPKVIDNLEHFLNQKDKQVTIEAAKGTIFSAYKESKGSTQQPHVVLALKIETQFPEHMKMSSGTIIGTPKEVIEGAIAEDAAQTQPFPLPTPEFKVL